MSLYLINMHLLVVLATGSISTNALVEEIIGNEIDSAYLQQKLIFVSLRED
jgi:hypothetical protein